MITNFISILFVFIPFLLIYGRISLLLNIVAISSLAFLIASNRQNNDFFAYMEIFDNPEAYAEIGYIYLVEILKFFGASSHISVIAFLSFFVFITLFRLTYITKYTYFLVVVYYVFLLPVDLTQIRYTLATFFIINSIIDFSKKRYVVAFIYLIVSFSFHYFSILLVFLVMLSLYGRSSKNIYKITFLGFIIFFLILNIIINYIVSSQMDIRTLNSYFTDLKITSLIIWGGNTILAIIIINYFKVKSNINLHKTNYLFILIMNISIFSLIFSPGLLYIYEFNRLYRTVFMLLNIAGILLFAHLSLKYRIFLSLYLFLINLLFGFYYSSQISYDYVYWGIP